MAAFGRTSQRLANSAQRSLFGGFACAALLVVTATIFMSVIRLTGPPAVKVTKGLSPRA